MNLVIEPGQTVALVGKSGSGKSTLASLIPRFYESTSGEILVDGEPVKVPIGRAIVEPKEVPAEKNAEKNADEKEAVKKVAGTKADDQPEKPEQTKSVASNEPAKTE